MGDLPTDYDVIVVGTGLVESIYAAAAARVGKSILHVDRNEHYSGEWAVLNFKGLEEWIDKHSTQQENATEASPPQTESQTIRIRSHPLVHNVTQHWYIEEGDLEDEVPPKTAVLCPEEGVEPDPALEATQPEPAGSVSSEEASESGPPSAGPVTEEHPSDVPEPTSPLRGEPAPSPSSTDDVRQPQSDISADEVHSADAKDAETAPCETHAPAAEETAAAKASAGARPGGWTINRMRKLSRRFNIDLAPKVLYSRGSLVELLISSNISRYAEFRAVGQLLTPLQGELQPVPSSRADVFTTRHVSVVEKRLLMKLLTFCAEFEKFPEQYHGYEERPFSEFLRSRRLTDNLTHHVTHAIAMVTPETRTLDALRSTRRFLRSLGRYGSTPFLWPMYGSGELPQCFCRLCAVFGGVYYLSRGVDSITLDETGACTGVTSQGQQLSCRRLLLEASYRPATSGERGVSRAIVFTDRSLYPSAGDQVLLIRLPADESCPHPITVIQAGPATSATPAQLYVLHLTCGQTGSAEQDLSPAVERLRALSVTPSEPDGGTGNPSLSPSPLMSVLGVVYFNRGASSGAGTGAGDDQWKPPENVSFCDGPDEGFDFQLAVEQARALFTAHFPDEEFLPRAPDPEEIIFFDEPAPSVITGGAQPLENTEGTPAEGTPVEGTPAAATSAVHGQTPETHEDSDDNGLPCDGAERGDDGSGVARAALPPSREGGTCDTQPGGD